MCGPFIKGVSEIKQLPTCGPHKQSSAAHPLLRRELWRVCWVQQDVPPSWPTLGRPKLFSGLDLKQISREADQSSNVNSSLTTGLCHALHDGIDPAPVNYRVRVSSAGQQNKTPGESHGRRTWWLSAARECHRCVFLALSILFDRLKGSDWCGIYTHPVL